ncbi:MAG: hypothetical protein R3E62_06395 [Pseudomonadales bacterium]|jgi:hypothetical protein
MTIGQRIKSILAIRGMPKKLGELTRIDKDTWNNIKFGKQKANEEHIEEMCNALPEFKMWIGCGMTKPENGQFSPEVCEPKKQYQKKETPNKKKP